jgi:hypothetical protein
LDTFPTEQLGQPALDALGRIFRRGEHLTNGASPGFVVDED